MEQTEYIRTRIDDLANLNSPISDEIPIYDTFRVFSGDGPARQFEAGQPRGGNFPCICGAEASSHGNLVHCFQKEVLDLDDRKKIAVSKTSKAKLEAGNINPYKNLKKQR